MKGLQIVLRVFGFAVTAVWVLTLITVAIGGFPAYSNMIATSPLLGISTGGVYNFLQGWYWFTIAVIGAIVSRWGFNLVGKWEKIGSKEELEVK